LQQETQVIVREKSIFLCSQGFSHALRSAAIVIALIALFFSVESIAVETFAVGRDLTKLPPPVQRMRQEILKAAATGDVEALRVPIEMNEIPPVFAKERISDPIGYLKSISGDGEGREILAILYNILTTGYAITSPGTKEEMIVWPYHAVAPMKDLSPSQQVELYRFLSAAQARPRFAEGRYRYFRIGIAPDGVWHFFLRD
jgi:hypothetical protein